MYYTDTNIDTWLQEQERKSSRTKGIYYHGPTGLPYNLCSILNLSKQKSQKQEKQLGQKVAEMQYRLKGTYVRCVADISLRYRNNASTFFFILSHHHTRLRLRWLDISVKFISESRRDISTSQNVTLYGHVGSGVTRLFHLGGGGGWGGGQRVELGGKPLWHYLSGAPPSVGA